MPNLTAAEKAVGVVANFSYNLIFIASGRLASYTSRISQLQYGNGVVRNGGQRSGAAQSAPQLATGLAGAAADGRTSGIIAEDLHVCELLLTVA